MRIDVNGAARELPDGSSVADLVAALGLRPEVVAIEVEGELVPRTTWAARALVEGQRVEVVTLVGGG